MRTWNLLLRFLHGNSKFAFQNEKDVSAQFFPIIMIIVLDIVPPSLRLPAKTRLTLCCFKARPSSSTLAKTLKHHCLKPSCLLYTALLFSGFTVIMGGHVTRLRGDWCPDRWPPGVLGHLNHLSHHHALKHHFTSLKADLILLQPKVLERKSPWNWLSNT